MTTWSWAYIRWASGFGLKTECDRISSRRAINAMGNAADAVGTSSRRVGSGMISIFSNYRLRIIFFWQYHASLVKYRFLSSYSAKSRIYVVFCEFYDHLTCLYLCLGGFRLTVRCLGRRRVHPNGAQHKRWRGRAQWPGGVTSGAFYDLWCLDIDVSQWCWILVMFDVLDTCDVWRVGYLLDCYILYICLFIHVLDAPRPERQTK
jgi:hypothetical protein